MAEMLRSGVINDEIITRVSSIIGYTLQDFVIALSNYEDSPLNRAAVERMLAINCEQTAEDYESILSFLSPSISENGIMTHVNDFLYEAISQCYERVAPFASIPKYIINKKDVIFEDMEGINDPSSELIPLPDPDEATEMIYSSLKEVMVPPSYEEMIEQKMAIKQNYINEGSDRMRIRFLQPVYFSFTGITEVKDLEKFRQWGPANPFVAPKGALMKQSCRMLTCIRFVDEGEEVEFLPHDPFEDYRPLDWFKGNCDVCKKRIKWYHHAVRMPIEDGGWYGCYCSWKCVLEHLPSEGKLIDQVSPNPMRRRLLNLFKRQIEEYGIYDRKIEEDKPTSISSEFTEEQSDMIIQMLENIDKL